MRLLYPDDPLDQRRPEGLFAHELDVARARGFDVSIFSFEDFERGRFNPKPRLASGERVIYRGWMLNLGGYARLEQAVAEFSAQMVVFAGELSDAERTTSQDPSNVTSLPAVGLLPLALISPPSSQSAPL